MSSTEIWLRKAANDVARVAEERSRKWRNQRETNQDWVRGYLDGMAKAGVIIAWHADQYAARATQPHSTDRAPDTERSDDV